MTKAIIATIISCVIIIFTVIGYSQTNQEALIKEGWQQGYEAGYDLGYNEGVKDGAGSGYNIRDPTYQEMLTFLASDPTDKNIYNIENYTCQNFANDVINNAFNNGIKAGYVWVEFPEGAHALVCFQTTDKGLIYIEPQYDHEVSVIIGQKYFDRAIYEAPDYDDTIIRYGIIW